jgi:copper chaperone CopZ
VAAGRDAKRITEAIETVPGIETIEYDVVEVEHTVEALTDLFSGSRVICNTVGPFANFGEEVVEAALAAGCHYLDTTGEQNWVLHARDTHGRKFADAGLLLAPSTAYMHTVSDVAANVVLETPGIDSLELLTLLSGTPTFASTQSIFTILAAEHYYLEQDKLVPWPGTAAYKVQVPLGNATYLQTGAIQAYTARQLIVNGPRKAGFASACTAFGHREILGMLQGFGFLGDPLVTGHVG